MDSYRRRLAPVSRGRVIALALGVKRGSVVYVDGTPVEVVDTEGFGRITLRIGSARSVITDSESVEILPDVFVSCGRPSYRSFRAAKDSSFGLPLPRLLFEAPKHIRIHRAGSVKRAA